MKKTVALLMSVMLICSVFAQVSYADGAFPQDGAQPGAMQKDPDNQAEDPDNKESSDPDKGEAFEKGEAFGSEKRSEAKNEPGKSKDIGDVEETPEEGKLYYPSKRTGYDAKKYDDIPTVDEYYVAEGDGQVWYREGTQGKATFVIKNKGNDENTYSNFSSVAIDGIKPPSPEYDCKEGSLILNIFSSYLRDLQDGYHEVTIDFKGAYPQTVKTGFQVQSGSPVTTHKLYVSKRVEGKGSGDSDRKFTFTLTLKETEDDAPYDPDSVPEDFTKVETGKYTFTLSHGDAVTLPDLPSTVKYTVEEADYSDTYSTFISSDGDDGKAGRTVSGTMNSDRGHAFTNRVKDRVYVEICGNSADKIYDNKEHKVSGFEYTVYDKDHNVMAGDIVSVKLAEGKKADARGTNAGEYLMELEEDDFIITPEEGYAVEDVIIKDGKLAIQPKEVTVKADDKNKLCGEKDPEFTATVSGTVTQADAEKISYSISREPGEAHGTYPIIVSAEPFQGNYKVTTEGGILLIIMHNLPVVVNITGNKDSVTYDGKEHTVSGYSIDVPDGWIYTEDDFAFSGNAEIKRTDAGTYSMGLDASQFKNTNEGFGNVTFNVTDGSLNIDPKKVTVTANNKTKAFGDADPTFDATVNGTIGDDKVVYDLVRDPGETVGTYAIKATGEKEQGNYEVTCKNGMFTITKADTLSLTATGYERGVYDGKDHEGTVSVSAAVGTILSYSTDGGTTWSDKAPSIRNVGKIDVIVKATNPNYSNEPTAGYTLEVIPKEVTVRTGSASKTYDGKPLTKDEASITGLVEGENATARATGSRTKVGKSKNTYTIDWGETDKDNYKVSGEPGTLEVLRKAIVDPDDDDKKKKYKGKHSDPNNGNGSGNNGGTGKNGTGKNGTSVTTGDHQDITGMIVLALIALAALIFIAVRRRRNNN